MFTAGEVYHDEVGLQAARDRLALLPTRRLALSADGWLVAPPSGGATCWAGPAPSAMSWGRR